MKYWPIGKKPGFASFFDSVCIDVGVPQSVQWQVCGFKLCVTLVVFLGFLTMGVKRGSCLNMRMKWWSCLPMSQRHGPSAAISAGRMGGHQKNNHRGCPGTRHISQNVSEVQERLPGRSHIEHRHISVTEAIDGSHSRGKTFWAYERRRTWCRYTLFLFSRPLSPGWSLLIKFQLDHHQDSSFSHTILGINRPGYSSSEVADGWLVPTRGGMD